VPECETLETAIELQADQQLILVAADGGISGTLDAVEEERCSFGFDRTRSGLTLELEGTASSSALTRRHTGGTTAGYMNLGFLTPAGTSTLFPSRSRHREWPKAR